MDNFDEVSAACGKTDRINSRKQKQECRRCNNIYHVSCIKLTTVRDNKGESVFMCGPCLAEVNAPRSRSSSAGSATSAGAMKDISRLLSFNMSTASTSESGGDDNSGSDAMTVIMERLQRLGDDFAARSDADEQKMEGRFESMESKFENKLKEIQSSISVLDQLPSLFERVSVNQTMIADIVREQKEMRLLVESRTATSSYVSDDTMKQLEAANKNFSQKISRLTAQQAQLSRNLLISGLKYGKNADPRLLSIGVLEAVYPEEGDILNARSLISTKVSSEPFPSPDGALRKSHPIVVTLSSSALVRVRIWTKIKARKLHFYLAL